MKSFKNFDEANVTNIDTQIDGQKKRYKAIKGDKPADEKRRERVRDTVERMRDRRNKLTGNPKREPMPEAKAVKANFDVDDLSPVHYSATDNKFARRNAQKRKKGDAEHESVQYEGSKEDIRKAYAKAVHAALTHPSNAMRNHNARKSEKIKSRGKITNEAKSPMVTLNKFFKKKNDKEARSAELAKDPSKTTRVKGRVHSTYKSITKEEVGGETGYGNLKKKDKNKNKIISTTRGDATFESLDVPTPSVEAIAKKHNVDVATIESQLKMGIKVEMEHTTDKKVAREIALDHLNEMPDYYTELAKVEEGYEDLSEVLSLAGRRKMGMAARRNKGRLKVARRRQSRKVADKGRLQGRARRQARATLVKKLTKGASKGDLSPQRRAEVERRLDKMKARIDKISTRILPKVRKQDLARKRN